MDGQEVANRVPTAERLVVEYQGPEGLLLREAQEALKNKEYDLALQFVEHIETLTKSQAS
ncbi:hypothetical protein [Streptomyces sp. NPDC058326]|uniref:hypothetical protein n=1 Tax=Streptomyces sp. NPDC058326 TaxID=3346447 RepID=UPI0036ED5B7B